VLAARDLRTGEPLWAKWIDHHVISAPVVHGDEVYIVTFAGTLYEFRLSDGKILMARRCHATSAPVVRDDGIYLTRRADNGHGMPQECLVKLDRRTGAERYVAQRCWAPYLADPATRAEGAKASPLPAIEEDALANDAPKARTPFPGDRDYVAGGSPAPPPDSRSPSMQLIGRDGPEALQTFCGSRLASFHGGLVNSMGGLLRAVNPATGAMQWELDLDDLTPPSNAQEGDPAAVPPAIANGTLFVATRGGQLLRIDPVVGDTTGQIDLGAPAASQPVIDQGRVLVGTSSGELVCIDTGDRKLTGWNQWGGDPAHSGVAEVAAASRAADNLPPEAARTSHRSASKDVLQSSADAAPPSPQELKAALKAFGKQVLRARLSDRSYSGSMAITPPPQFPQPVWDELVRLGKLRSVGGGKYELAQRL
jgi:hypothetical protein